MSVSYRHNPEAANPAPTRPCSECGHNVSLLAWQEGVHLCARCEVPTPEAHIAHRKPGRSQVGRREYFRIYKNCKRAAKGGAE